MNLLGRWSTVGGTSYITGGLCYYLVPFTDESQVFVDPIRTFVYAAIMVGLCTMLSSAWTDVARMSAKDVRMTCHLPVAISFLIILCFIFNLIFSSIVFIYSSFNCTQLLCPVLMNVM